MASTTTIRAADMPVEEETLAITTDQEKEANTIIGIVDQIQDLGPVKEEGNVMTATLKTLQKMIHLNTLPSTPCTSMAVLLLDLAREETSE